MKKLITLNVVKEEEPSKLKKAIILYPYLHCWRSIKEGMLGKRINKFV